MKRCVGCNGSWWTLSRTADGDGDRRRLEGWSTEIKGPECVAEHRTQGASPWSVQNLILCLKSNEQAAGHGGSGL